MQKFLTSEYAGVGGVIKTVAEDFAVEEQPLYQPSGERTHVYILIEKKEISTMKAMAEIARGLGIRLSNNKVFTYSSKFLNFVQTLLVAWLL